MSLFRNAPRCALMVISICGCRAAAPLPVQSLPAAEASTGSPPFGSIAPTAGHSEVVRTSFQEVPRTAQPQAPPDVPVASEAELSLPRLVDEVLACNPSLEAMTEAWRAAAERYPQVTALQDPMVGVTLAPGSFGTSAVEGAYTLEASQKLPWFGKRAARGRSAQAEADAIGEDLQDTKVRLVESVQIAFLDYYLVRRQQDLNVGNTDVMRRFRDAARTKYDANQVTQQDLLQADVELTELDRRKLELERMNAVAVARINTLLRRPPGAPLPPPPAQLPSAIPVPELPVLQQVASQQRPDLAAVGARVRAEEANVTEASKEYYPDTEVFGHYDTFWQPASTQGDLRGQVGVRFNLPIYRDRLNAAVREATFRLSQRQAEYQQKLLDVQFDVQIAYAQLEESQKGLALYADRLLPVARQNVSAARSNYELGKASFLELAMAQRQLISFEERYQEALATYHRRLAELNRAVGGESLSLAPADR